MRGQGSQLPCKGGFSVEGVKWRKENNNRSRVRG